MRKSISFLIFGMATAVSSGAMAWDNSNLLYGIGGWGKKIDTSSDDANVYGIMVSSSDTMTTVDSGIVRNGLIALGWGDTEQSDVNTLDWEIDLGYRFAMANGLFVDMMGGLGWTRLDEEYNNGVEAILDTIFIKPGVAVGQHFGGSNTLRLEVGSRYSSWGRLSTNAAVGDVDLENTNNVYAELSWLNQSTAIPLQVDLYYRNADFEFDDDNRTGELNQDMTGVRLQALF